MKKRSFLKLLSVLLFLMVASSAGWWLGRYQAASTPNPAGGSSLLIHPSVPLGPIVPNQEPQTGYWGYTDSAGEWLIKPKFMEAWSFHQGRAIVRLKSGELTYIRYDGFPIMRGGARSLLGFSGGRGGFEAPGGTGWGFVDSRGNVVIPPKFSLVEPFSEGKALVLLEGQGAGFIDTNGKLVIGPWLGISKPFSEGLAAVTRINLPIDSDLHCKYGYIDHEGDTQIEYQFRYAGSFQHGLAPARKEKGLGLINRAGVFVTPEKYEGVLGLYCGYWFVRSGDKWYVLDPCGREIGAIRAEDLTGGIDIAEEEDTTTPLNPVRFESRIRKVLSDRGL